MAGLIGSVIMPHNLYLHSSLAKTRKINRDNNNSIKKSLLYYYIESGILLFIAMLINGAVISTFAEFYNEDLDIDNAGKALEKSFGNKGKYIWAIGLLAAGQSSTCSGTLAGQFVMEVNIYFKIIFFFKKTV